MNHKLKIQLIALMAFISGTALGNCQAMQVDANSTPAVGNGVVRPADPDLNGGAFGAVKSALPVADYGTIDVLPPIVSPASAAKNSGSQQPISLPPIISPNSQQEVKFQPAPVKTELETVKTESTPVKTASQATNMLVPLAPQTPAELPFEASASSYAPAPVIRTTSTTTNSGSDQDQQVQHASQWNPQIQNGVSAAGVPLYPQATPASFVEPQQSLPPIVSGSLVPAIAQVGNGSMPKIVQAEGQLTAPGTVMPYPSAPVMTAPTYADPSMNQTYFNSTPMEAPVITSDCGCGGGGCTDCGVASSSGGAISPCQSCGTGGCFDQAQVDARFNASGSVYYARRYLIAEVLYVDRYDGTVALSNFGGLNNFDDNLIGARLTLGDRQDAANGREFTWWGTDKLSQTTVNTDALGRISAGYADPGTLADPAPFASETTAFRNATEQVQEKTTTIQSLEFNKVNWGWDVVKTFVGLRYIYIQDTYDLASTNLDGETGLFELRTQNNLLGPQFGNELYYDVGYRFSLTANGKYGIYVNPNQVDTRLLNAGAQFLDLDDDNVQLSATIELGFSAQYKLSENSRFRVGYNVLYVDRVSGVSDNIVTAITPTTGSDTSDTGQMTFQSVNFGFEVWRK